MATIQWRPEVNALTYPQSCRICFVSRNTAGEGIFTESLPENQKR